MNENFSILKPRNMLEFDGIPCDYMGKVTEVGAYKQFAALPASRNKDRVIEKAIRQFAK